MIPAFEWTIRAGDLLTFVGGLAVAASFLYRRGGADTAVKMSLKAMMEKFTEMEIEFKSFSQTLQKVAIQEMQIGLLMKWYDELRRGKGIVKDE